MYCWWPSFKVDHINIIEIPIKILGIKGMRHDQALLGCSACSCTMHRLRFGVLQRSRRRLGREPWQFGRIFMVSTTMNGQKWETRHQKDKKCKWNVRTMGLALSTQRNPEADGTDPSPGWHRHPQPVCLWRECPGVSRDAVSTPASDHWCHQDHWISP
jgi:hypothetical protein